MDVGESLLATQLVFCLYLSNTASLDLPLDAGASSPARQPYLSNLLLNEAYPSDTAIPKPVGRRREPPGQTALTFQTYCSTRLTRPTRRFRNQSDVGESLRDRQLSFSILRPARPTQPRCPLTARPSDPLNFAFLSKPIRLGEPRSPDGRRREHSRSDNFIFSSPRATRLTRPTRQFRNHSRTSARASQPDNLTISSPKLGEAYPSDMAIAETIVGRRREPPSQTNLPFKSHARRGLPVQHSGYCAPVGRRREPPSQTNSSFPSARTTISNPVERYVPGRSGNLSFQSTTGEVQPSRPPVGCRQSIPNKTLPFRLHLSDTVSLDLPSVAGESTPGQTTLPFLVPRWRRLPVQHSGYCAPVGRRREPHSETTYRFPLGRRD